MGLFDPKDYPTIALDDEKSEIVLVDQTLLPNEIKLLHLSSQDDIWEAIRSLRVRGAPAIGVAAAFALYLAAKAVRTEDFQDFEVQVGDAAKKLSTSRPTAVNLFWALERMLRVITNNADKTVPEIKALLLKEALEIRDEDIRVCKAIGENAISLLAAGDGLLTHCNAGRLATVEYGTATAAMYLGQERGYDFRIYCDETRPLLQGARLTAFELSMAGMTPTVLCDNMSASLMQSGAIDAVLTGADRIAANGDAANKIGTQLLAIAANYYKIPFYVCAPTSTIDASIPNGEHIPIEHRDSNEIAEFWYEKRMTPDDALAYNPAFDVTPASLITAIITERGVFKPPFNFIKV